MKKMLEYIGFVPRWNGMSAYLFSMATRQVELQRELIGAEYGVFCDERL